METTTVFRFRFYYDYLDDEPQSRYVVADSAEKAWEKLTTYFELMHREGYARPIRILEPTVEIDNAII